MIQHEYFFEWSKTAPTDANGFSTASSHNDLDAQPVDETEKFPHIPHSPMKTVEVNDAIYDRLPNHRKRYIVALLSYCAFLAPVSSTAVLAAVPEVAKEYQTTGAIINLSNAFYMAFMGISPCFWGPLSQVYGRRWVIIISSAWNIANITRSALQPPFCSFFAVLVPHWRQISRLSSFFESLQPSKEPRS